jgi:heme-binding protein
MNVAWRRWGSWLGISVLVILLVIQLVPYGRSHVNPPIVSEPAWDSPGTRELAKQACFDCHSNETQWPVYTSVAPVSWLIQRDVDEGRAVLNFSEWQRPQKEATESAKAIQEGEMPPAIYRLMHGRARLSSTDLNQLARGLTKTLGASPREGSER